MLGCQSITWLLLLAIDAVVRAEQEVSIKDLEAVAKQIVEDQNKKHPNFKPACDDKNAPSNWKVFCGGDILSLVNLHRIYPDSKTFVDMPMKADIDEISASIEELTEDGRLNVDKKVFEEKIEELFDPPGTELEECELTGWEPYPKKIMRIKDKAYREWALVLNEKWKKLCRKTKELEYPERHSLIKVPHEFVVPGGRFREFYYWDAYWIVKGLLVSGLYDNVKKMILNYMNCVKWFSFVPLGGRIYYLKRSQPPMLIPMAYEYYKATKDLKFIIKNIKYLVKEYEFWLNKRSQPPYTKYSIFGYNADSSAPRPESYLWDLEHAISVKKSNRFYFWKEIASAAESGWDFSSRWFADKKNISTIQTTSIVPVDLIAILCWNARILMHFFIKTGNQEKVEFYKQKKSMLEMTLRELLYNETFGAWFDFNTRTGQHNTDFNAAMIAPAFTGCYKKVNSTRLRRAVEYFKANKVFDYPSGIPTTLRNTGEQWDFPNGWSPLQHMFVEGLRKSQDPKLEKLAFEIADKWVKANYKVYQKTGHMYEKLNVISTIPEPGVSGDHEVQEGYGWTNGVILDFLNTYYDRLSSEVVSSGVKDISQIPLNYFFTIVFLPSFVQRVLVWIVLH